MRKHAGWDLIWSIGNWLN